MLPGFSQPAGGVSNANPWRYAMLHVLEGTAFAASTARRTGRAAEICSGRVDMIDADTNSGIEGGCQTIYRRNIWL
jgi:hypothetical protein